MRPRSRVARPALVVVLMALSCLVVLSGLVVPVPAWAATTEVSIVDNAFRPAEVQTETGTTVRWTNSGAQVHTVTADDLSFDSGNLQPGATFVLNFTSVGDFRYFCRIHGAPAGGGMSGRVTVAQAPGVALDPVVRLAGPEPGDRVTTAVAVSKDSYNATDSATSAVLARSDAFPDALAGAPLAVAKNGPLLLTGGGRLDERVRVELQRALPRGRTVFLLGGDAALAPAVAEDVTAAGYVPVRLAGSTRAATAVDICRRGLGAHTRVLEADGTAFADALAAGAASAHANACVLLTDGRRQAPETQAYLDGQGTERWAVGGAAAAADPGAMPLVGADRFETAVSVARAFFVDPPVAAVASGVSFPDGLGGGAHVARRGGPLLLAVRDDVPPATAAYLRAVSTTVNRAWIYGGTAALTERVRSCVQLSISASSC